MRDCEQYERELRQVQGRRTFEVELILFKIKFVVLSVSVLGTFLGADLNNWHLFIGKNGILVVDLGGLDTKIMFLSPKINKIQAIMLIFTMVREIASEDPLGINIFQKLFHRSYFSPKGTL